MPPLMLPVCAYAWWFAPDLALVRTLMSLEVWKTDLINDTVNTRISWKSHTEWATFTQC